MAAAGVDPGAFFIAELRQGGAGWRFASAFACNDTTSFLDIWAEHRPETSPVVLLNARADRPLRTRAFLATLAQLDPPVRLVLTGRAPVRWALGSDGRRVGKGGVRTCRSRWSRYH